MARAVGPDGRVFAFEPIPRISMSSRSTARLAPRSRTSRLFLGAIRSTPGHAEFVIPEAAAFAGYYLAALATPDDRAHRVDVRLETLDALLAQGRLPPPAFIKCDVEGHDWPFCGEPSSS